MDARQDDAQNPFGMDEECRNCPELCGSRERVVHGYGDAGADFMFVGERPSPAAEETGVPLASNDRIRSILERLALCHADSPTDEPEVENVYCTLLTRCRHPDRPPSDEEIGNCDPYLNAEIRMINPHILIPVGDRALSELAVEYTTTPSEEFDLPDDHARTIRGRGFDLVPLIAPGEITDEQVQAFVEHFAELMASDYRKTKGRRER